MSDCAWCFITGEFLGADVIDHGDAKFTHEFDAWIGKRGQQEVDNAHKNGDICGEWETIWNEWNVNA